MSETNIKPFTTPLQRLEELKELVPKYETARLIDIEDDLKNYSMLGRLSQEDATELLFICTLKRITEYKKGESKPDDTALEFMAIMKNENIHIRYNEMTNREEIFCDLWKSKETIGLAEEQRILMVQETVKKYNFPTRSVRDYIKLAASPYHPVRDWINEKEWDGEDRLDAMFNSLGCINDNQELAKTYFLKWCLQGCRAVNTQRGFVSENVLILKGNQGTGKTRWLSSLLPRDYIKTGLTLSPGNKDSVLEAVSVFLVELGEFDGTTSKSATAMLKAFFSKKIDWIRRPFAKAEEPIPRQTIFCGSVNTDTFLNDDTGNRRYWVIEISEANPEHKIDIQQFWAQVMTMANKGTKEQPHWLINEEAKMQDIEARKFRDLNPICQRILAIEDQLIQEKYSTQEIASLIEMESIKPHESKVIKQFMLNDLGWTQSNRGGRQYWLINPNVYVSESEVSDAPF